MPLKQTNNYRAFQLQSGDLAIFDVEISRTTTKKERPDFLRDLDGAALQELLDTHNKYEADGKAGSFVLDEHFGPGRGILWDMRVEQKADGPNLVSNMLVKNPDMIERIKRGELTERSIEWKFSKPAELRGVALMAGRRGHDSIGWPDLTIKMIGEGELTEEERASLNMPRHIDNPDLGLEAIKQSKDTFYKAANHPPETVADIKSRQPDKEQTMTDMEKMMAKIAELESKLEKAEEPVNEKKINEALAKLEQREIDLTVNGFVDNLARKGYSNKANLRKTFEKFGKNTEAMEVEYRRLMEKADEDVSIEMEKTWEAPSKEDALKAEYAEFKTNYPDTKLTEKEYINLQNGAYKVDLSGKTINVMSGSTQIA